MEQTLVHEQNNQVEKQSFRFVLKDEAPIHSLGLTYQAWEHMDTGAMHIHLQSGDNENVFLVGLRTVPQDDTGVAHILEHTALCGSKKYPVRDPFFMMIRRSINTFMNAFTSSDWTAYPFASANHKDFENLLSVYLDAVFASRLDAMDFSQEGHRFAFSESDNSSSDLVYQGVVYNEMKGAMSNPTSVLWQHLTKHLFPETTYHYNSGGDPMAIPSLSHEDLLAFYHKHYHPSNAIFMTYGDLDASWYHERFDAQVCQHFSRSDEVIDIPEEPRWQDAKQVEVPYPCAEKKSNTYHIMAWLLNDITDYNTTLQLMFLSKVLLDHSGSPLAQVLETSDLGQGTSPIQGILDDARMLGFACGIEGSERQQADKVKDLILSSLHEICQKGVPIDDARAVLRQFELEQREVTGGHMPYGLELILRALPAAVHRGNPRDFLAIEDALSQLTEAIEDPSFIPQLIKRHLLQNQHQLFLTCYPDTSLAAKEKKAEEQKLKQIEKSLSAEEKQAIIDLNQVLDTRQKQEEDLSILPEVLLDDLSPDWSMAKGNLMSEGGVDVAAYPQPTNGLVYQASVATLPDLTYLDALAGYQLCAAELGCGEHHYIEQQSILYAKTGGVSAHLSIISHCRHSDKVKLYFTYSGKALISQACDLAQQISAMKQSTRLDEQSRIEDLLRQYHAASMRGITARGHEYAMMAAMASLSAPAALRQSVQGLDAIKRLGDELANFDQHYSRWVETWGQCQQSILQARQAHLVVSTQEYLPEVASAVTANNLPSEAGEWNWQKATIDHRGDVAYLVDSQVNFCALAFPSVGYGHKDDVPLSLLALILRNGYCHRAIREQGGAYGGGAVHKPLDHAFVFYSYRDPRIEGTFSDFEAAIAWACSGAMSEAMLKEAQLGLLAQIDKPLSPAAKAKQAFYADLEDRPESLQKARRDQIFTTTLKQIVSVAKRYLSMDKSVKAVVAGYDQKARLEAMEMSIITL